MRAAAWAVAAAAVAVEVVGASAFNGTSATPAELISAARLPLSTQGGVIVDNAGDKVRLACVNWYGAHMEQYAVSGLHVRPLGDIVQSIVDYGFNCIRLPFSLELIDKDPLVPNFALAANVPLQGQTGMELLDTVVAEFAAKDLLVVLNNHNSKAGWCCDVESDEGLWNTPEYSTDQWADLLANITARYAAVPQVVAFDLRNEIHDVGDKVITWGETDNKDLDWKVASELAAQKVQAEDSDMLVIFSGLCFGGELRPMVANPPNVQVPNKMVYTTHTYGFSVWWQIIPDMLGVTWPLLSGLAIACLVFGLVVPPVVLLGWPDQRRALRQPDRLGVLLSLASWALGLSLVFIACGVVWIESLTQAGCLVVAQPAYLTIGISAALAALSLAAIVALKVLERKRAQQQQQPGEDDNKVAAAMDGFVPDDAAALGAPGRCCGCCLPGCAIVNLFITAFVVVVCSANLVFFADFAQSSDILEWDLTTKWAMDDATSPIWVGEFGGNDRSVPWWTDLTTNFLKKYELSWAYWAWDGQRWYADENTWKKETYGILNEDYATPQHPLMLLDLHGIQRFKEDL